MLLQKNNRKKFLPLLFLFAMANAFAIIFHTRLVEWKMDPSVIIVANLLLFAVTAFSLFMQLRAITNKNPHAIVRAVMAGMGLKLVGLGAAVFGYISVTGAQKSVNAILVSMGLYVLYTLIEIRIFLSRNAKKNVRS